MRPEEEDVALGAVANAVPTDQELFLGLSSTLTGLAESELPVTTTLKSTGGATLKLYEVYFSRLMEAYGSPFMELVQAWRTLRDQDDPSAALAAALYDDTEQGARLRVAARQIIKIWYLSTIDDPTKSLDMKGISTSQLGGDVGQFQLGVAWKLIGAPPQGYSPNMHGYWSLKPVF